MIADTKALTLAEWGKEEGNDRRVGEAEWRGEPLILLSLAAVPWRTNWGGVHSHKCQGMDPA
jgi:hypothetical protein